MAFAIVQHGYTPAGSSYPVSYTFPSPVTAGNRILIFGGHSYAGAPVSVNDATQGANKDSLGNVYAARGTQPAAGDGTLNALEVFEGVVTTGGTCAIRLTAAAGNPIRRYFFLEVSGLVTAPAYDTESITSLTVSASGAESASAVTTAAAGDVLFVMCMNSGTGYTLSTGSGYTQIDAPTDSTKDYLEYAVVGAAGSYTPTVTFTGSGTATVEAAVLAFKAITTTPPTSAFSTSTANGNAVTLTDASTQGTNPITSYDTDWGDGAAHMTSASGTHTYTAAGTYTITHTVSDGTLTNSVTHSVTIQLPPTSQFSVSVSGMTVTLTDTSTAGSAAITTYNTGWGDASPNGTTANGSHTYTTPGSYLVGHGVTDANGHTGTQYTEVTTTRSHTYAVAPDVGTSASTSLTVPDE